MAARIEGFVDGVSDGAVHGWIANVLEPSRLERVIFQGEHGASLSFSAFLPRPDVSQALGAWGRFGFSAPVETLRALGRRVRLTDAAGDVLRGGEIVRLPEGREPPRGDGWTYVMLHIQKTAGTSLRLALSSALRPYEAAYLYPDGFVGLTQTEFGCLPHHQLSAFRLVMGHLPYGAGARVPGKTAYLVVLRRPEARLRSHYRHHLTAGTRFTLAGEVLETRLVVQHALVNEFDNFMTRSLIGVDASTVPARCVSERHVAAALANVRASFRFVALTERLDEHYAALCATTGFACGRMEVVNAGQGDEDGALDSEVDWDEAMRHNRFDAMLYDRIQEEGLCGRDLFARRQPHA